MKERQEKVKTMREAGMNYLEIAKALGVSPHSVRATLNSIGMPATQEEINAIVKDAKERAISKQRTQEYRDKMKSIAVPPKKKWDKIEDHIANMAPGFTYVGGYTGSECKVLIRTPCSRPLITTRRRAFPE